MKLKYVICFIRNEDKLLMLHRNFDPNKGLWNGVGGKIDPQETPREAVIREIFEETGLTADSVDYHGIVTWNGEGGMYLFSASAFTGMLTESIEGRLEWKPLEWVMSSPDVVSSIPVFLPDLLAFHTPMEFALCYKEHQSYKHLLHYEKKTLPDRYDPDRILESSAAT